MSTREEILKELRNSQGFVSGQDLAGRCRISRSAVWKQISNLRIKGYRIESYPRRGYRLLEAPDLLLPEEIRNGLEATVFGRTVHYHSSITSTNERAKALAAAGASEGTIVVAEEQRRGVGRLGREWFSPPGGIWFSLVLRPLLAADELPKITILASEVVARVVERESGVKTGIKWPNDVTVAGRKMAGILTEMTSTVDRVEYAVVGIGLNVNFGRCMFPADMRNDVTTLLEELGREVNRAALVRHLLESFEEGYSDLKKGEIRSLFDRWRERCETLGSRVKVTTIEGELVGVAKDIDSRGALRLELKPGLVRTISAGDVTRIR